MTLSSQTKVGLTFGQIIAVIGLFGSLVYAWTDINVRVGRLEQQYQEVKTLREENRQDHSAMSIKVDEIYKLELQKSKF